MIPPLMENDGVSALVGITRHNSLFHPSKDRSPDTKSLVCMHKSTDSTSTSIQIRLTLPLISQVRLRLSLVQLLEWCSYKCMQICKKKESERNIFAVSMRGKEMLDIDKND